MQEKKKFYTCKYDRAFKEVFMKEDNKDILTNLLEPEDGIKEKLAKNIAVTIAEKDNEADIISVKLFKFFGLIFKYRLTINVTTPKNITKIFLFNLPFFIIYTSNRTL